jgi:hypothetical protein
MPDRRPLALPPKEASFSAPSLDAYLLAVSKYYETRDDIIGMGENDWPITFSGTVGDPLADPATYPLLSRLVDEVQLDRGGVAFRARTSGLALDPADVRNGVFGGGRGGGAFNLAAIEVFLPGGDPAAFGRATEGQGLEMPAGQAFGRVCEVMAAIAESEVDLIVGVREKDRAAMQLGMGLGATEVKEY